MTSSPSRIALLAFLAAPAHAQCGDWVDDFGSRGANGVVRVLEVLDVGAGPVLHAAGAFSSIGAAGASRVARHGASGWEEIGGALEGTVEALAVFDDGSGPALYAGGAFARAGDVVVNHVARWNGTAWEALGAGVTGGNVVTVRSMTTFDDGTGNALYVGGSFAGAGGQAIPILARWNGTTWTPVGGGITPGGFNPDFRVRALEVFDDGSGPALYVGGLFQNAGGVAALNVARWNGVAWSALGAGLGNAGLTPNGVADFAVFDDGAGPRLFAAGAGNCVTASPKRIHRWDVGSWTPVLVPGAQCPWRLSVLDVDGVSKLWMGAIGAVTSWDGTTFTTEVAQLDPPGFQGSDLDHSVPVFAASDLDGDGSDEVVVGGPFLEIEGLPAWHIARRSGTTWSRFSEGEGVLGFLAGIASFDDGSGAKLHAVGRIKRANDLDAVIGLRYEHGRWVALDEFTSLDSSAYFADVEVHDDGSGPALYVAGNFFVQFPGHAFVSDLIRWDGQDWSDVGGAYYGLFDVDVGNGPTLYGAASFGAAASEIRRIDGPGPASLGVANKGLEALIAHDDGSGPALYGAGPFSSIGGTPFTWQVARWNGGAWTALGAGLGPDNTTTTHTLCSHDDGSGRALYAGGSFTSSGAAPVRGVARWNGATWTQVGGGIAGDVQALASVELGGMRLLVATGEFTIADGAPADRIAVWDGATWSGLGGGLGHPLAGGLGSVPDLAVVDVGDGAGPSLFVSGNFATAGGVTSLSIARFAPCGGPATEFCFGDGSANACPCGNASAVGARAGCLNSIGTGGTLRVRGQASLAHDTLVLEGAAMTNSSVLYFQGQNLSNGGFGVPFGDGVKCTNGPFIRLGNKSNVAGASQYPEPADVPIALRGAVTSPGTRHYQARYRNVAPFCTPDAFNYTSAVSIPWAL